MQAFTIYGSATGVRIRHGMVVRNGKVQLARHHHDAYMQSGEFPDDDLGYDEDGIIPAKENLEETVIRADLTSDYDGIHSFDPYSGELIGAYLADVQTTPAKGNIPHLANPTPGTENQALVLIRSSGRIKDVGTQHKLYVSSTAPQYALIRMEASKVAAIEYTTEDGKSHKINLFWSGTRLDIQRRDKPFPPKSEHFWDYEDWSDEDPFGDVELSYDELTRYSPAVPSGDSTAPRVVEAPTVFAVTSMPELEQLLSVTNASESDLLKALQLLEATQLELVNDHHLRTAFVENALKLAQKFEGMGNIDAALKTLKSAAIASFSVIDDNSETTSNQRRLINSRLEHLAMLQSSSKAPSKHASPKKQRNSKTKSKGK